VSSKQGRKWLLVIPFSPALRFSDFEVSTARQLYTHGLRFQGLRHTAGTVERQTNWDTTKYASGERTVARHEQAKRAIGTALGTLEGVQVHLEPLITGTQRRNDLRITG
jgi:hypothetical protein